jgi:hypothetical protein
MQRPYITDRPLDLIALCALITSGFAATPMHAQQTASGLPATAATNPTLTSQLQTPAQPASRITYGTSTEHPATVTFTAGQLSVTANDSSLNQILRAISRATGMKITGGITDERVFGTYGPDNPAKVLSALLDGTSSNMLIIQSIAPTDAPVELVLSPRTGGPTPPNPNPQPFDNTPRSSQPVAPVRPSWPIPEPTPPPPATTSPNPGATAPGAATPGTPIGGAASSSTDSTDQQSPNGVRTPQQIYEQLQQIRQLQLQQQQQTQQTKP